jgi:hypothetical protein
VSTVEEAVDPIELAREVVAWREWMAMTPNQRRAMREEDIPLMPRVDHPDLLLARALLARHDVAAFVVELATEDCSYGDDCPSSARHYRCLRCKALHVAAAARLMPGGAP